MPAKQMTAMLDARAYHRPRVALYSHDTMGIGHMRRNLLIAQALAAAPVSATVLLVAGAREARFFSLPPNVDCLTLPSLMKSANGLYHTRALDVTLRELINLRTQIVASALKAFAPDVLIVDKEPRGALRELDPALEQIRSRGKTRCVLGLRDVLDEPITVRREWRAAANEDAVRDYYDAVWIYGDPSVYDLIDECHFRPAVISKVSYTGYLDPRERLSIQNGDSNRESGHDCYDNPFVLCMVGGGQDGTHLAEAFAAAQLPAGRNGVIITGPCMPEQTKTRLRQRAATDPRFRIFEFHPEPCRLVAQAERIVAMGGYNTVSEILAFEKPAFIVPRVTPRREQLIRVERLQKLGLLDVLHPDRISADAVSNWLSRPAPATTKARQRIDFRGLTRIPELFQSLISTANATLPGCDSELQHAAI